MLEAAATSCNSPKELPVGGCNSPKEVPAADGNSARQRPGGSFPLGQLQDNFLTLAEIFDLKAGVIKAYLHLFKREACSLSDCWRTFFRNCRSHERKPKNGFSKWYRECDDHRYCQIYPV